MIPIKDKYSKSELQDVWKFWIFKQKLKYLWKKCVESNSSNLTALLTGTVVYADCTFQSGNSGLNETTCWPWVVTRSTWTRDLDGLAVLDPANEIFTWLATLLFYS